MGCFANMSKKKEDIISYCLVIVGIVIYVSLVFNNNVWLDEAFTASLVRTDMAGVLERSMADTLPPLYNILLKLSTDIFGYTVPVMKITSVIPMVITMILSATIVRRQHGFKTSALFTIALFSMPNLLFFGVEIRMYSLGFLFATASGILAYDFIKNYNIKNLIAFTLVSVLAGYSHHFAFVSVGFVYLFVFIYYFLMDRHNIKRWFICLGLTFVLYFPCLVVTIKQFKSVSGYFSMPEVTLAVFLKYARYPFTSGNTVCSIVLLVSCIGLFIFSILKIADILKKIKSDADGINIEYESEERSELIDECYALAMFAVYYGVLVFGTIVSKIMTANIFVDRYLLFAHGMMWLFFSIEAGKLKKYYMVFLIIEIAACMCGYLNEFKIEYSSDATAVIEYLQKNVEDGDILYTIEDSEEMAFCLPFYDEALTNYEDLSEAVKAAKDNNSDLWLTVIDYSDYDFKELEDYNLKAVDKETFEFDRYKFDIYRLAPAN